MLVLSRGYVAYLLLGYGEPDVSAAVLRTSDEAFRRVQDAANRGALQGGEWLKIACRAAIEVVEGEPRELRRRQLNRDEMRRELLEEGHKAFAARKAAFLSGAPVKKPEIMAALSAAVAPQMAGYKFLKARAQFQKSSPSGVSYLGLHRGRGAVHLSFGVTNDAVVRVEQFLFGPRSATVNSGQYPRTVVASSLNIGPCSHYWPHVIDASWLILGDDGIRLASREAVDFVRDVVVLFIDHNQSPACIRKTLLSTRGTVASARRARTVFAVDHLERRRDWVETDLAFFKEQFQDFSAENREKLQREYRATVEPWDAKE